MKAFTTILSCKCYIYIQAIYTIFIELTTATVRIIDVFKLFIEQGMDMYFTTEVCMKGSLKFLDVEPTHDSTHVGWKQALRCVKPTLNYQFAHMNVVKNGIAISLICTCDSMKEKQTKEGWVLGPSGWL